MSRRSTAVQGSGVVPASSQSGGTGPHQAAAFSIIDESDWQAVNSAGCFGLFIAMHREGLEASGAKDGEDYLRQIGRYRGGYLGR